MIGPKDIREALRTLQNFSDALNAAERNRDWFRSHYFRMLKENSRLTEGLLVGCKKLAEAPDVIDVAHNSQMVYLWQIEDLIERKS